MLVRLRGLKRCGLHRISSRASLALILITSLAARLINLNSTSIWYDEACAIFEARDIFYFISTENFIHPPFYYLLLSAWMKMSSSVWMLRLPSVIFGVLSVYLMFVLGSRVLDSRTGLWAAAILGFSPFHIYYAQEIKMYTMVTCLSALSIIVFLKYIDSKPRLRTLVINCLVNTAFIYTSALSGLQIIAMTLFLVVGFRRYRNHLLPWLTSSMVTLILFLPVLRWWSKFAENMMANSWVREVVLLSFLQTYQLFTSGFYATGFRMRLIVILCLFAFMTGIYILRFKASVMALLLVLIFLPQEIMAAVSIAKGSIYLERTLIFISVPFYIILAVGFSYFRNRVLQISLIVVLMFSISAPLQGQLNNERMPFRNQTACPKMENRLATKLIRDRWQEGDVIVHTHVQSLLPCIFYLPVERYPQFHALTVEDTIEMIYERDYSFYPKDKTYAVFEKFQIRYENIDVLADGRKRIWLVASNAGINDTPNLVTHHCLDYLQKSGRVKIEEHLMGLQVYLIELTK